MMNKLLMKTFGGIVHTSKKGFSNLGTLQMLMKYQKTNGIVIPTEVKSILDKNPPRDELEDMQVTDFSKLKDLLNFEKQIANHMNDIKFNMNAIGIYKNLYFKLIQNITFEERQKRFKTQEFYNIYEILCINFNEILTVLNLNDPQKQQFSIFLFGAQNAFNSKYINEEYTSTYHMQNFDSTNIDTISLFLDLDKPAKLLNLYLEKEIDDSSDQGLMVCNTCLEVLDLIREDIDNLKNIKKQFEKISDWQDKYNKLYKFVETMGEVAIKTSSIKKLH